MREKAIPGNGGRFVRGEQADFMSELRQRLADLHGLNGIGREGGNTGVRNDSNLHAN